MGPFLRFLMCDCGKCEACETCKRYDAAEEEGYARCRTYREARRVLDSPSAEAWEVFLARGHMDQLMEDLIDDVMRLKQQSK